MLSARFVFSSLATFIFAFSVSQQAALATVKISAKPTQNMSCSSGVCSPTGKNAVLNVTDLTGMLASGDATVKSDSLAQDIEIDAPLGWTSSNRLTLDSHRSITFNRPVSVTGTGAITIFTNHAGSGGDFRFLRNGHIRFRDLTSDLIINGDRYALVAHLRGIIRFGPFVALARRIDLRNLVYTSSPVQNCCAVLEGLGNTISNLTVHAAGCGGLMCNLQGTVRDLGLVSVDIAVGDTTSAGAIAGQDQLGAVIANSYATGQVSVGSHGGAGGLIGASVGLISHSYAAVTVTGGDDSDVGGLVGAANRGNGFGSIDQSYATGIVSGGNGALVGGLAGLNNGAMISNSYAMGSVSGTAGANVGGLIGLNENNNGSEFVYSNYATGAVSGGQAVRLGGLIGLDKSNASIANTYWDLDTSGIGNPHQGAGNIPDDPGITGLTDAQLKSGLPPGFSGKLWKQNPNINSGYPYLTFNPPQ